MNRKNGRIALWTALLVLMLLSGCPGPQNQNTPAVYTITVAGGITNGTVTVSPARAEEGTLITVTAAPAANYKLAAGTLKYNDGTDHAITGNTFTMPAADVTVSAAFIPEDSYSAVGTKSGNGDITFSSGPHYAGDTVTITVTPGTGWRLKAGSLKYNDGTDHAITGNTFTMPAVDVTVTAEFEQVPYTVSKGTISGSGYISFTPAGGSCHYGDTVTVTVSPVAGWQLRAGSLKYNGTVISGPPPYTFTMPAENVTVTAEFEKIPIPVTGVSVTPSTAQVAPGVSITLTANITPSNADDKTITWTSDNASVATVSGSGLTATVTVQSTAGTGNTAIITAAAAGGHTAGCTVTVKEGNNFIVNFNGFGDEAIDLSLSTENDLSRSGYENNTLTVTYTGLGAATWYLDGQMYNSGSSITIDARSGISLGVHYLSAVVRNGAEWVSKEVSFRVVE
jgi:uncharacterized protein YjdB